MTPPRRPKDRVIVTNSIFADSFFQHQQQVLTAVERAKQVSMSELNAIIGVSATSQLQCGRMDGSTNGLEGERSVKAI